MQVSQLKQIVIRAGGVAVLLGILPATASAQTTIYSTFGPGDSYVTNTGIAVFQIPTASQWVAASFVYGGPIGFNLAGVRIAAEGLGAGDATVTFMSGVNIATANPIESWVLSGWTRPPAIFSFASATANPFVTGETYWLKVSTGPSGTMLGGWMNNDQGLLDDVQYSTDQGATWAFVTDIAPAWDVSGLAQTVTPEPATMTLFATGLIGLVTARRRRKKILTG